MNQSPKWKFAISFKNINHNWNFGSTNGFCFITTIKKSNGELVKQINT